MKDSYRWSLAGLVPMALLAGCGGGVSGDYGGEECLYEKLAFESDDKVYVTFFGMETPGTYKIDGDRVILTTQNGQAVVFTQKDGNLEASLLGDTMVCSPI